MFDIEGSLDRQILSVPRHRPTVIFVESVDPRVVEAACHLARFVRPVFLAPEPVIRGVAAGALGHVDPNRVDFALSESAFLDLDEQSTLIERFASERAEKSQEGGQRTTLAEARRFVSNPAHFGIAAVQQGHADIVVGGATHEPKDFFRPMVKALTRRYLPCEAGVFVLPDEHPDNIFPHNIVVFGDVGVNATMTPEMLAHVAVGTCAVARDLIPEDVLPEIRGAIVSYSHRGSDEGPSPELVRRAAELVPGILADRVRRGSRYASIRIDAEVKMSVALSERSAMYYRTAGRGAWSGGTNVIICPNLDMGNLLYHLYATRYPTAKKFSVMFGLAFRGVDLAMDCTPEDVRLAVKAAVVRLHRFGEWQQTPRDTFFRRYRVLAVNPGSTSTKISVYEGEQESFTTELQHSAAELAPWEGQSITNQFAFRKDVILKSLAEHDLGLDDMDAVAARGGLLRPMAHGTYRVGEEMLADLKNAVMGEHASNLGALIAHELAGGGGKPAFIVDPVVVDEAPERVKIAGIKAIRRKVISHALNQIATARRYAEENETFYEKVNVIVAHMGGGISIGAHKKGRYVDVNNALDGEGPFTPQRSGSLPTGQLIDLCFSGKYTKEQLKKLNKGRGGLIDLLGTADLREVERRIEQGDVEAARVFEAMVYQITKWITSLVPAFDGERVDRILLTGGMARSKKLVDAISGLVAGLGCGVTVYPGENEMFALVKGALRVLNGKEQAREYHPEEGQ
ncbi:MAG TPA: butyrate kinase [Thermoanaerobaculaceae bacterium]|nr:butyrate kinase [Thermoanaerobaculaceae bacterium]